MSIITLLGLFIIGVVYQLGSSALRDQFDQRTLAIATNLSDAAAAPVVSKNVLELSGLVRKYALLPGVEYAFIDDGKGAVIAHTLGTFPPELKETVSTEGRLRMQRRALRFRGNIVYETSVPILGGQVGAAHLGMRGDFVEREIRNAILPFNWDNRRYPPCWYRHLLCACVGDDSTHSTFEERGRQHEQGRSRYTCHPRHRIT